MSREICSVCFYRNLNFCLCQRDGAIVPEGGLLDTQRDVEKPRCCCKLHEQRYGEECRCAGCGSRSKSALSVETFQIIGPQHTRTYRHVVFAVLSVPVGNGIKTVAVTKETEQASIMSTGGGESRSRSTRTIPWTANAVSQAARCTSCIATS